MMMAAHIPFPNLRSPESVGEIRKGGGAISASALVAEISRRFRAPQISEQQPFNLPNPEAAEKIIYSSSLLGKSHCWERGCKRAGSLRKIFLPTKFSCPTFRGSGPGSSTRSLPSARHRSTVFRLMKAPVEGRNILWVGPNLSLTSYSAKKCAVKEGDCCALHC